MKRMVSLLFALVLALSCVSALAETYDQPILFRGIPWGISYEELKERVALTGLESISGITTDTIVNGTEDKLYEYKEYTARADFLPQEIETIGDIAGYELLGVDLYFAWVPEEDGSIPRDEAHTALYGACYTVFGPPIDPEVEKTNDEIVEDLTAKLSSLYGEPDPAQSEMPAIWRGAEGTLVSLRLPPNHDYRYIAYVTETGDAMLKACLDAENAAAEAAQAAREDAFSANTNGL